MQRNVWLKRVVTCVPLGLVALFGLVQSAFAADPYGLGSLKIGIFRADFFEAMASVINFILLIGGILAFFYVIYGGFIYLTSGGDPGKATTGTKMITNAIVGIIIIFLSLALVRFVTRRTQTESSRLPLVHYLG